MGATIPTRYLITVLLIVCASSFALAQPVLEPAIGTFSVYPTELYSSDNEVTVSAPGGIRGIRLTFASGAARLVEFDPDALEEIDGCPKTYTFRIRVNTSTQGLGAVIHVAQCSGDTLRRQLDNMTWRLDRVIFPDAEVGEQVCQPFQIGLTGLGPESRILDSVTVGLPFATTRLPFPLPVTIAPNTTFRYQVCVTPTDTGYYKFPVVTWMRRTQPTKGLTTYPVADTGVIRIVERRERIGMIPDTIGRDNPRPIVDPTTFRSVAIPNAVVPKKGRFFVGSYDFLGLVAGYSFTDEIMILAGGAAPLPDDWAGIRGDMFGAYSAGAKLGLKVGDNLRIGGGYQFGQSFFDKEVTPDGIESRITFHAPYGAISYGNDDRRVSITGGYAFKRHKKWLEDVPGYEKSYLEFDEDAAFGALGGDYRFARHWKIAGEVAAMQTLDVVPIILTGRYFTSSFAIDFGVGYVGITLNDATAPKVPLAPVLSGVFVF